MDEEKPEWFGDCFGRTPASEVLWWDSAPEWGAYYWIARYPATPPGKYSWQRARPEFLRFVVGTSWTRHSSSTRSLEEDYGITPRSPLDDIVALGRRLAADDQAKTRQFWSKFIDGKDNPEFARIEGMHYALGNRKTPHRDNGMSGRWHTIEFDDGRTVRSCDLWYQGRIPRALRSELPDNAKFVTEVAQPSLAP